MRDGLMTKIGHLTSLLATLSLLACAPGAGQNQVIVATPPPDGTACYESAREPFYAFSNRALVADQQRATANRNAQSVAVLGGVATIAGLAIGGNGGRALAAVGALAAVAGALNSNVQTDQRFIADASYSFSALVSCRQAEARQVRADVRARRLTAAAGRERLVALRDLLREDSDVALRVNYALSQRNRTYLVEADDINTQLARETNPTERQQRAVQVAQARQTIQTNQRALTDQATTISQAASTITLSAVETDSPVRDA